MEEIENLRKLALVAQKRFGYFRANQDEQVTLPSGNSYWNWRLECSEDPGFPGDDSYDLGEHTIDRELAEYIAALSPEKVLALIDKLK